MVDDTKNQVLVPRLDNTQSICYTPGNTDESVVLMFAAGVDMLIFTPEQARELATILWELADNVDGGQGVS